MTPLPARRLCLDLPFLATDQVRRAAATAIPPDRMLVLTETVGLAQYIAEVDARAARAGLRPGISLAQAQAVAPGLAARPRDLPAETTVLEGLADWAVRFSPLVAAWPPHAVLIDITGCGPLFGGDERIAELALAGLSSAGFFARAAIADTPGAACALASTAHQPISIAAVAETAAALAPLPPAALRIEPQTVERLAALGIRRIGDLLQLPRSALPARFGPQLNLLLQRALGEVFEGVPVRLPRTVPHARLEFEHPVREPPALQAAAADLLRELFAMLQQADQALRRLDVYLFFEHQPHQRISIRMARAARNRAHVNQLLQHRLEASDPAAGVSGLMLVAGETARWRPPQAELFEPDQAPEQEEQLGLLLDRLANRLGPRTVFRPTLLDDYQPELAAGQTPATADPPPAATPQKKTKRARSQRKRSQPPPPPRPTPARPTQLLPRPVPIRVISQVPDGPPTWLSYRGREYIVRAAWGPERIETGWWRGPDVRRDYFRVETDSGVQFWVYHAFNDGRWYLHGVFG